MKFRHCLAQLAFLAAFALQPLAATPVTIANSSFEARGLQAGSFEFDIAPGWTGTLGNNQLSAFVEHLPGFVSAGTTTLGMELNYDVWQDLAVTYQANTRYTLTVGVGNREAYYTLSGNQSQYLLADSTGVVRASGENNASLTAESTFVDGTPLVFDTSADPTAVGKTIRILLRARGEGRSHFDNIRLDATTLNTATVRVTAATAVTTATATLNGQVTAIGSGAPSITLFWGTTQGGTVAGNWQKNVTLPGTQSGTFSTAISGLSPASVYYFAARATNGTDVSWSAQGALETTSLAASISTGVATQISSASAKLGVNVTATGGEIPTATLYYGTTDGGSTASNWTSNTTYGLLNGSGSVPVSGLLASTTYYFRAFAQNSGGGSWAPASSSFTTLAVAAAQVVNAPATGITGTTATLRGEVTDTGNDPPTITIFYGLSDGGATTSWSNSAEVGVDSGDFTRFVAGLTANTTYFYRCRATNTSGTSWAPTSASFTTTALVNSTPVIHEIHYNPADDLTLGPLQLEFVELHNPGDTAVNLSSWKLTGGLAYTFPAATTLNPGGYLVIAQNPTVLASKYPVTALGPWIGKLSNSGDTVELRDAANLIKDTVSYQPGFPWPTSANGSGPSIELMNPALDNDLGGSWRSSSTLSAPAGTLVSAGATGWKYFKGTSEASFPTSNWRALTFNDSTWLTGRTPIGYGSTVTCNTVLADMQGDLATNYSTIFARKTFTIAAGQVPDQLTLNVRLDDGCIVWINGTEVFRAGMPAGDVPFSGTATDFISTAAWTFQPLTNTSVYLVAGTNVITIQAANVTKGGSSDFNIDAEILVPAITSAANPSPRAANGSRRVLSAIPPQARQVTHTPNQPTADVPVTITARITDPDSVGTVTLSYQTVEPGAYIRKTDPGYLTGWTSATMFDNGTFGDLVAGDSIFTAIIPAAIQTHRRLVRYKLAFNDTLGNSQQVPFADDEQPNFAYFVYNGVPAWTGTLRPGAPAVTYPTTTLTSLQTYHLIADGADVNACQYDPTKSLVRFYGTIVYDGVIYDHVQFKVRGQASTYVAGKNKWNISFNRSRDLVARDNWGKKYDQSWNNLLLNANASPWVPAHRGSGGIEEASSARIYELASNTAFRTNYAQFRVIDGALESSPTSQYDGDLWGLYLVIEPPKGNLLDERNLPDGNIYSTLYGEGDKKHQGAGQPVDSSDWIAFRVAIAQTGQTEAWYRANMDLDKLYTFMALNRLIGNVDVRPASNFLYYRRSSDNRWEIIGYDFDMNFIATHHWGGTMDGVCVAGQPDAIRAIMRHPNLAREYRNRCRELMDLLASDGLANGGQIGQLLHEYANLIHPTGQTATWANLDATMWNLHPRTRDQHSNGFFKATADDQRGNLGDDPLRTFYGAWRRTLPDPDADGYSDFPNQLQWFINFATSTYPTNARPWFRRPIAQAEFDTDLDRQKGYGYKYLEWESIYGSYANSRVQPTPAAANTDFPARPTVVATGNPAFPTTGLTFSSAAFLDPQGAGTYSAWQWRIAEISAPGIPGYVATKPSKYEIESLMTSAELTTTPGSFTIPLGVTTAGKTYRVRVRHKDTTGNWSHWSTPAQFAATTPVVALVHYWNFNLPATQLTATRTIGGGAITATLGATAEISSDTKNSFAAANSRNGDLAGNHLRLNNPLGTTVNIAIPTVGHQNVLVQYETRRSTQSAATQTVAYTVNGTNYTDLNSYTIPDGDPVVLRLDFRDIPATDNNHAFALRITFQQGTGGIAGNNRLDNLTVEGDALAQSFELWKLSSFPNLADRNNPAVSGPNASPSGDGVANLIRYALGIGAYQPVTGLLPKLTKNGSGHDFRFRYDASKSDLIWRVKGTSNLTGWPSVLFDSRTSLIPPLVDGLLPVLLPNSLGAGPARDPKMFARLEVQLVTP